MILNITLATICFAGITAIATALEKPYYHLQDAENLFKEYLKEHKKTYNSIEYLERFQYFTASLKEINDKNAKFPNTVFKVNHFADLRPVELEQYFGFRPPVNETTVTLDIPTNSSPAPDELDWRKKGVVSHVKNQAICGSCFIFSAIGNIEGQYAIKHNKCIALSEQQILDCLSVGTCYGGKSGEVIEELAKKAGVMTEADYPYVGNKGQCHEDTKKVLAVVKSGGKIDIPDEATLKQKLADIGPLAVSLNANDLQFYSGGILHPDKCTGCPHDHAVVLVGYGEEKGQQYWLIKNSWGVDWGEAGYVRLQRGVNACGMGTSYSATAVVA